jgi:hypothetical protein
MTEVVYPNTKSCSKKTVLMNTSPLGAEGYLPLGKMVIWKMEVRKG